MHPESSAAARERCVIYARESPSNATKRAELEGRQTPFETQIAECLALAEGRSYQVVGEPLREVESRAELWDRDVLNKARQLIRDHQVEVLLVHAMERLAIGNDFAVLLSEATYHGARIEFVIDPELDPTTPEGAIVAAAKAYSGHVEHQRIRERTQRGLKTRLAAGRPLVGPRPKYGYRWIISTYELDGQLHRVREGYEEDPVTGPVVRRLFARALEGATLRGQVAELHRDGVPSPTGREWWDPSVIRHFLLDPWYTGRAEVLRWASEKKRRRGQRSYTTHRLRPVEERQLLPEGTAPVLVDAATSAAVQDVLVRNQAESARSARWPDASPLKGHAFCGGCGGRLYVVPIFGGRRRIPPPEERGPDWRPLFQLRCAIAAAVRPQLPGSGADCVAGIVAKNLEEEVLAELAQRLAEPDALEAARRTAVDLASEQRADVTAVGLRLQQVDRDVALRERQLGALDPGRLPAVFADVTARLEALIEERRGLVARRAEREARAASAAGRTVAWEQVRRYWREQARACPPAQRRDLFRALELRVTVWRADATRRPAGAPRWTAEGSLPVEGLPAIRLAAPLVLGTRTSSPHNIVRGAPLAVPLVWHAP